MFKKISAFIIIVLISIQIPSIVPLSTARQVTKNSEVYKPKIENTSGLVDVATEFSPLFVKTANGMKKMIEGVIDFRKKSLISYREKFSKLALKQFPDVLFVACCDSRVVPNIFVSSCPGDLFVLRNIGNLIPVYPSRGNCKIDASVAAAIEYSLLNLKVGHIVICGHSECGAMKSLLKKGSKTTYLDMWLKHAKSSYKRFKNCISKSTNLTQCNLLSRINVLQQMDNLKTYPLVMELIQKNKLKIHGWWFDLATADVYYWKSKSEKFILIDEDSVKDFMKHF